MVLVSLVLVVLAAVTLVIGLLQSGVTIIYISIACSLVAGIVLFVAVRRGRPDAVPAGAAAAGSGWSPQTQTTQPAPIGSSPQAGAQPVAAGEAAASGAGAGAVAVAPAPPEADEAPEREAASWRADQTEQLDGAAIGDAVATADGDVPIADYDRLRASDIMPLLADLDTDDLQAVRAHEEAGKHRFTVLRRIDDELAARESSGWEVSEDEWAQEVTDDEAPAAVDEVEGPDEIEELDEAEPDEVEVDVVVVEEDEDEFEDEPEPEPAPVAAAPGGFPIANYDQLMMLEVLPRLVRLDVAELEMVRQREEAGLSRSTILNRIDRLVEQKSGAGAAAVARVAGPPRGRKAPARKAPATKTPRRAPARKASEESAPTRSASVKRAPTKKAGAMPPAKKATGQKVTGRKAAVPKAAAVAKKAPAKKATVTKAVVKKAAPRRAPAKKTAARKTPTRSRKL